jgi:hypothetical protein
MRARSTASDMVSRNENGARTRNPPQKRKDSAPRRKTFLEWLFD